MYSKSTSLAILFSILTLLLLYNTFFQLIPLGGLSILSVVISFILAMYFITKLPKKRSNLRWVIFGIIIHAFNLIPLTLILNIRKYDDGGIGIFGLAFMIGILLLISLGFTIGYWVFVLSTGRLKPRQLLIYFDSLGKKWIRLNLKPDKKIFWIFIALINLISLIFVRWMIDKFITTAGYRAIDSDITLSKVLLSKILGFSLEYLSQTSIHITTPFHSLAIYLLIITSIITLLFVIRLNKFYPKLIFSFLSFIIPLLLILFNFYILKLYPIGPMENFFEGYVELSDYLFFPPLLIILVIALFLPLLVSLIGHFVSKKEGSARKVSTGLFILLFLFPLISIFDSIRGFSAVIYSPYAESLFWGLMHLLNIYVILILGYLLIKDLINRTYGTAKK